MKTKHDLMKVVRNRCKDPVLRRAGHGRRVVNKGLVAQKRIIAETISAEIPEKLDNA